MSPTSGPGPPPSLGQCWSDVPVLEDAPALRSDKRFHCDVDEHEWDVLSVASDGSAHAHWYAHHCVLGLAAALPPGSAPDSCSGAVNLPMCERAGTSSWEQPAFSVDEHGRSGLGRLEQRFGDLLGTAHEAWAAATRRHGSVSLTWVPGPPPGLGRCWSDDFALEDAPELRSDTRLYCDVDDHDCDVLSVASDGSAHAHSYAHHCVSGLAAALLPGSAPDSCSEAAGLPMSERAVTSSCEQAALSAEEHGRSALECLEHRFRDLLGDVSYAGACHLDAALRLASRRLEDMTSTLRLDLEDGLGGLGRMCTEFRLGICTHAARSQRLLDQLGLDLEDVSRRLRRLRRQPALQLNRFRRAALRST